MFFTKKKKIKYDTKTSFEEKIKSIEISEAKQQSYIIELCEQMVDASKEYGEIKAEYDLVTRYLKDVEILEDFPEDEVKELHEAASSVWQLTRDRNDYLQSESKITESQFAQMQELEDEIPAAIKRLKHNESYLDVVSRDMRYLEGEKTTWEINKKDSLHKQSQLRKVSVLLVVLLAIALSVLCILSMMMKFDTKLVLVVMLFFAVAIASYVIIKYQDCTEEIKKSDVSRNKAITLENRVKLKYVNTKNAVDYACEKYHVKNSYELNYMFEEYMNAVRERERFKVNSERLEYYNKELLFLLTKHDIYDIKSWMKRANAIIDKKEMVEVKHNLLVRRQKLREQMEYNLNIISNNKEEVTERKKEFTGYSKQIDGILNQIDKLELV